MSGDPEQEYFSDGITEAEIDEIITRFGRALDDTAAIVEDKGLAKAA